MKAAFICFVGLPFALAAFVGGRCGFRLTYTLLASAVGEGLGLWLYAAYTKWKVAAILSGKASGAVAYVGTASPRSRIETSVALIILGFAIGLIVLFGHWIYDRARSA